ncbi:MAG TPA: hypothetical protein VKG02_15285 [Blastocatellia bacterium]|nr:hypothetical protein [Blastocatellia bacterium]
MKNNLGLSSKSRLSFLAPVIIALFLTPVVSATDYGDVSVKVETVSGERGEYGYAEYRATITNRSATRARQVTLIIPGDSYSAYDAAIREMARTVEVAAGATVTVSLFQPPLPMNGSGMAVRIDGRSQKESVPLNLASLAMSGGAYYGSNEPLWLLSSQSVDKSGALNRAGVLGNLGEKVENTQTGVTFVRTHTVTAAPGRPLTEWSASWLSYSGYNGVVVNGDDLLSAPAPVQDALWRYVECGGVLLIFGQWTAPQQWRSRQSWLSAQRPPSDEEEEETDQEKAEATPEKPALTTAPGYKPGKNDLRHYFVGYGMVIVSGDMDAGRIAGSQWARIIEFWSDSHTHRMGDYLNVNAINRNFPVVEELGTPVRGLFLLMLLFAVVIGPVNYMALARRKKRTWLWWTAPAIAVVASLAVFGYAMLAEGWQASVRAEVMTILDENARRATTVGLTAFYAPLTPSDGLRFSYDTEVTPLLPGRGGYYAFGRSGMTGGASRTIDWTEDQHLAGGWITARVPVHFIVRKSEPRRERLNVRREGSKIIVVNGLGADIKQLWWAEADGRVYLAENLQAGAGASLKLTDLRTRGEVAGLREAFRSEWWDRIKQYPQKPLEVLEAGCYLATLDSSPFLEEGLRGNVSRKAMTVVYGVQAIAQDN